MDFTSWLWLPLFVFMRTRNSCWSFYENVFYSVWSAAIDALTAFVRCFLSPKSVNYGILLQPVLVYLSRYYIFQLYLCLISPKYLLGTFVQFADYLFLNYAFEQCIITHIIYSCQRPSWDKSCPGCARHKDTCYVSVTLWSYGL